MHPQWWETLRCGCISCGSGSKSRQRMHPQLKETLRCGCISCGSGSRSEQKAHLHSLNLIQCGCAFQARECSERQINRENASAIEGNPPVRMHSPHRFCERRQSRNQWVSNRNPPLQIPVRSAEARAKGRIPAGGRPPELRPAKSVRKR